MTAQKHTPGDWTVDRSDRRGTHLYVTANMGTADVCRVTDNGSAAANARLIAAAPDMAEALRECALISGGECYCSDYDPSELGPGQTCGYCTATEALKKAGM